MGCEPMSAMIRRCDTRDVTVIWDIINEAAEAYMGVIPEDRWHEPYMTMEALQCEIDAGVQFWGYKEDGDLLGVMGTQQVQDVTLIRHAYVRPAHQQQGVGSRLLMHLCEQTTRPILIGTWADATWAIRFYEKHGFRRVPADEKDRLLRTYWSIPDRQIETSVVLADRT